MLGVSAILLAAGESRRMQQAKALLPWEGQSLIVFQTETLLQVAQEVIVVLGHAHEDIRPHIPHHPAVRVVVNPDYAQGRTTSIKAGLASVSPRADALLILAVDQPRPGRVLRALVDAHNLRRPLVTVPTYQGHRGHPPILSLRLLPELKEIREEGAGLREVMERHQEDIHEAELDSPTVLLDLNRPQDYRAARRRWREG